MDNESANRDATKTRRVAQSIRKRSERRWETGAERLYKLASTLAPQWSVPWYNLGLLTKNTGRWEDSLIFNQCALSLNPGDEGACWNLGIAATAMHDWPEARRAWKHYGIDISDGVGEVMTAPVSACVRLNPRGSATDLCSVLPRIGR